MGFRYAILDISDEEVKWVNSDDEHRWLFPITAQTRIDKAEASYEEFRRIIELYSPSMVCLKMPEYGRKYDAATLMNVSLCTALALAAKHSHVDFSEYLYANLKMSASLTPEYVLQHVPRCTKYWDAQIADALMVALKNGGK